jgi:hypothetical protein
MRVKQGSLADLALTLLGALVLLGLVYFMLMALAGLAEH